VPELQRRAGIHPVEDALDSAEERINAAIGG
jgi:hypothetical protein